MQAGALGLLTAGALGFLTALACLMLRTDAKPLPPPGVTATHEYRVYMQWCSAPGACTPIKIIHADGTVEQWI